MDLTSACIDKQVINFSRLQEKLVDRSNKCFQSKPFVHLQTQIPLIVMLWMINQVTEQVFWTGLILMGKCLYCISVEV
jgi:hypothetical protein